VSEPNERLVLEFSAAWERRDIEELLGYFTEDAEYHNMPMAPVRGTDAIRTVFMLFIPMSQRIWWDVHAIASVGDKVLTERTDHFVMGEREIDLPVMGTFEITGAKISAWRDYFDMAAFTGSG
jgi:limonene-1,2-epoxide hydrolase